MGDYSTIEIRGDNEELKSSLDVAEGMFKDFGNKVMSLFQQATGIYSFDDAIAKIKKGIADFEESQEHVRGLDRAMKAAGSAAGFTGKQMGEMNEQLQKISKFTENTITDAQAALSKFKNVRLNVFQDALKGASDLAEAIGGDLVGATKILGAALNDPRKGLEALEEAGVDLSRTQKNQIEAFLRLGRVADAQKIILDALNDTYGGEGAKAADTFGNRMAKMAEATDKIWKSIGGALVPWLNKAIDVMNDVSTVVTGLIDEWTSGWDSAGVSVEDAVKVAGEWLMKAVDMAVTAFSAIQTAIENWELSAKLVWVTVKQLGLEFFKAMLDAGARWTDQAIDMWLKVKDAAEPMWDHLVKLAGWGFDQVKKLGSSLLDYMIDMFERLVSNAKIAFSRIMAAMAGKTVEDPWWVKMTGDFKTKLDELPAYVDKTKKRSSSKMARDMTSGFSDDLAAQARATADAAIAMMNDPAWDKFGNNLDANKKRLADFEDKVKGILGDAKYRNITGTDSGKGFKLSSKEAEEGRQHSEQMGSFEDFASMHNRIQSAAAKPPDVKELEKQTKLMEEELGIQRAMYDMWRNRGKAPVSADAPQILGVNSFWLAMDAGGYQE